ncbi:hypothetical protein Tco_0559742 [Tanacetum coccineum]
MTHEPPEGVVRFTNKTDEVAYKMPHMIEQYNSLSDLEKEHTKSVYLRNEEDKKRGVEYVMSKILGFYKECLELGPEYVTGMDNEGEVTLSFRDFAARTAGSITIMITPKEVKLMVYTFIPEDALPDGKRFLEPAGEGAWRIVGSR